MGELMKVVSLESAAPRVVATVAVAQGRLTMVDAWRGIALLLMALEHAVNDTGGTVLAETYLGQPTQIAFSQSFLVGLLTNLAAPTFFLLGGVSVALLVSARLRRGASQWSITRFLLIRATVLIVLDLTLCAWFWPDAKGNTHVLLTLGLGILTLSILRFLPDIWLGSLIVMVGVGYQTWLTSMPLPFPPPANIVQQLLLVPSYTLWPASEFPLLGWCVLMWGGYLIGRHIQSPYLRQPHTWLLSGLIMLGGWLLLRLLGGWGDYDPYASSLPWYYFFVMSKAPPSLTYLLFNIGWSFVLFAALLGFAVHFEARRPGQWIIALGQVSLFVYVMHLAVYGVLGGVVQSFNLRLSPQYQGYIVWIVGLVLLIPLAYGYRRLRRTYPKSVLRYF
jgi:uncharacterized membrane protein